MVQSRKTPVFLIGSAQARLQASAFALASTISEQEESNASPSYHRERDKKYFHDGLPGEIYATIDCTDDGENQLGQDGEEPLAL